MIWVLLLSFVVCGVASAAGLPSPYTNTMSGIGLGMILFGALGRRYMK